MFSRRSQIEHSENRISLRLRELRTAGVELLDLTISAPSDAGLHHDASVLQALASPQALHYEPDPQGIESARSALSSELCSMGIEVAIEDILLTSSTSEAYSYLFKLLCDAGDEVLIPAPSYPLFEQLARLEGVRVTRYPLAYDGSFHIDVAALRTLLTRNTRAIVVVNPNNPTGSYLKREEFCALLALGLPIISDEVFSPYQLSADPQRVRSVLEAREGLVFSLGGLSKSASLPQLKLSHIAIAGDASARSHARQRLAFMADAYLSVATPVQLALPQLLDAGRQLRPRILQRLEQNLQTLREHCQPPSAITARSVEGGFYAIIQLPRVMSDESWTLTLLDEAHVLVQPGFFYDFQDEGMLVLSLLPQPKDFVRGLQALQRIVAQHT